MAEHEHLIRQLGLHLGHSSHYPQQLDPSLLSPVPRALARTELGLEPQALPFSGVDLWTGYELSWLDARGKPQVAVADFSVPCTTPDLIESKSFKLFLNSFNQSRFADWQQVEALLVEHLSRCAGGPVVVRLYRLAELNDQPLAQLPGESLDEQALDFEHYSYNASLLRADPQRIVNECLYSDLLKSNCLITHQPDWGSVLIRYRGPAIDRAALLRYLVSFRSHNEFHEQCVERIFCDLLHHCRPEQLTVYARYTRRGGLDINPFRSNFEQPPANSRLSRQ